MLHMWHVCDTSDTDAVRRAWCAGSASCRQNLRRPVALRTAHSLLSFTRFLPISTFFYLFFLNSFFYLFFTPFYAFRISLLPEAMQTALRPMVFCD